MIFLKNFLDWFVVKPQIHQEKQRPLFQEREIWMCHFGSNVGFELDGKKAEALRPIVVFKKISKDTLLAIPLSSHKKNGTWYSKSIIKEREGRYCLNQIRMIDAKRLKYWMEQITSDDFLQIQDDFQKFLKS
ncbi:MAG: type II toxin-antitoxin system PemK/MazF family toxin [Candidatus Peregrinibacteria bacterium]